MSKVEEIIDYYIAWEEVAERVEYKKSTPFEKEQIRLKYDEDAKYFKNLGYDDNTALHADVIVSFWTIYKTLLNNEAHWKVSKTLKSLEALRRQIQSKGRYSKKILEVNEMISEFAEICYTRGNYMLLPEGARGMNNQRYLFTEDRIDVTLYQCFGKGMLYKFFDSDDEVCDWIKSQYLDSIFSGTPCTENIIWMTKEKHPKLISEMSTDEILEYVGNAVHFINNREAVLEKV